ncbi:acyl-CoA thioesterase [Pseudomaricurvus alkylphenolicus]|jgi:acyl-CoA thioester hydrolase|uniref:acyl-CoA thioesterase n=1 Tax=Pseudomaricurvus alkylphenolicus TaxID=1306991 RepID=UPI001421B490|nr:acyl-CoA thioesterase [Pseudomaricurvus alkylphenolicus]NIB40590.1 acyl-CoA thioesterase [Pseudomaricurvus alkylphenolicus]
MFETNRAVVFPWHCDQYHHMNTRHYLAMFDDAGAHMMHHLGYSLEAGKETRQGWADVEHTIRYLQEVSNGALLKIESQPLEVGRKSLRYRHVMSNVATGEKVATLDGVVLSFDLEQRKAIEVPAAIRSKCLEYIESQSDV